MRNGLPPRLGLGLLLAGIVGSILLLVQVGPTVRADLRLDDYETSWPNHVEVQNAGVALITQLNDQALDLDVAARKDLSTVEIVAPADTSVADIDALVAQVVSQDADNGAPGRSVAELKTSLDVVLSDLRRVEEADGAATADISTLAEQAVSLRSQLAARSVSLATARSRFVPLHPASKAVPEFPLLQWVLAAALIGSGAAVVLAAKDQ